MGAKSGGVPGRCEKLEKELTSMSKAAGVDGCITETVSLMRCTSGSSRAGGCSAQFLAMRECNRASGRELISEPGGTYAVAPGKAASFSASAASLLSSVVPSRSLQSMKDFGEDYGTSLGINPGEVRF